MDVARTASTSTPTGITLRADPSGQTNLILYVNQGQTRCGSPIAEVTTHLYPTLILERTAIQQHPFTVTTKWRFKSGGTWRLCAYLTDNTAAGGPNWVRASADIHLTTPDLTTPTQRDTHHWRETGRFEEGFGPCCSHIYWLAPSANSTYPGQTTTLSYDIGFDASGFDENTARGQTSRERMDIYRGTKIISQRLGAWHSTPTRRAIRFRPPTGYYGDYRFCVTSWNRAGSASPTHCATFATLHPPPATKPPPTVSTPCALGGLTISKRRAISCTDARSILSAYLRAGANNGTTITFVPGGGDDRDMECNGDQYSTGQCNGIYSDAWFQWNA